MRIALLPRAAVLLFVVAFSGCRDGVPPFTPAEREIASDTWQLTFGYGQDVDPQWLGHGDSLLYHTERFGLPPVAPGVLVRIALRGGAAVVEQNTIHAPGRILATPAYTPVGDRIAYLDLMRVHVPQECARVPDMAPTCAESQPLLDSAALRVRARTAQGPIFGDVSVGIKFAGTAPQRLLGAGGVWLERLYPFQAAHQAERLILLRPSWSPTGQAIAFSDGLAIHTWAVGDATSSVIAGTQDGVSAAWSPDGEWIAFTLLERADSTTFQCICAFGRTAVTALRTIYTVHEPRIVIIRPDGSGRTILGRGEDPAWSGDGQHLYVRRDDRIVRITRAGTDPVAIPHTEHARFPALSPDGSLLAFSRRKPQQIVDYDIWVARLQS